MKAIILGTGNSAITLWKPQIGDHIVLESVSGQRTTLYPEDIEELREAFNEWFSEEVVSEEPVKPDPFKWGTYITLNTNDNPLSPTTIANLIAGIRK